MTVAGTWDRATTRAWRRDRLIARAPRVVAGALAAVLMLAGLRTILAGHPSAPSRPPAAAPLDLAAQGFAAELATRYLDYDASAPDRRTRALRALVGDGLGDDLGLEPPAGVTQRVRSARVVQDQAAIAGGRLITVAVDTDRHGLLDLSVPVRRDGAGRLRLAGYPALIGAPEVAPARSRPRAPRSPMRRCVASRAARWRTTSRATPRICRRTSPPARAWRCRRWRSPPTTAPMSRSPARAVLVTCTRATPTAPVTRSPTSSASCAATAGA